MSTIGTEWLNSNSNRAYPLREDCTLIATNDPTFKLPNYIIVDFIMSISDISLCDRMYLYRLSYVGTHLTLEFYNSCDVYVASVAVDLATHVANQSYTLTGQGSYIDMRGKVVVGDLNNLANDITEGTYTFTLATAEFHPTTIRPELRCVTDIVTVNNGEESEPLVGHIKLLAGSNIRLTAIAGSNTIRIDAVSGAGLNQECDCDNSTTTPITTINGINAADVQIIGDSTCVEVTVEGNTIKISDKCSQPCCGCPELEYLTTNLSALASNITKLEAYAATLDSKLSELTTRVITSL